MRLWRTVQSAVSSSRRLYTHQAHHSHSHSQSHAHHASAEPHSGRTLITSQLWEQRTRLRGADHIAHVHAEKAAAPLPEADRPPFVIDKKPFDSYTEIIMPFATDLVLREQYVNYHGGLRFGKILEDLDAMAGNIAHKHADDNNPDTRPLTIVTASVDRIDLLSKLLADRDMRMRGCVSHVGSSSMEVRVDVESLNPENNTYEPLILAHFTMVALWNGKPTPVNKIIPQTEHDKILFEHGEQNKQKRKEFAKRSLTVKPPDAEEVALLHNLFLELAKPPAPVAPGAQQPIYVPMSETQLQSTVIAHPQERNTNAKIFGGYLMRMAHELAWSNAHAWFGTRPWFLALDDVHFYKPVEIGSIVIFNSEVIYTEHHSAVLQVTTQVLNPRDGSLQKTNSFYFTFTCPEKPADKRVKPNTYEESMRYVDGRRRLNAGRDFAKSMQSRLLRFY